MSPPLACSKRHLPVLHGPAHQRGVGMIEVLVAVLVLSIGLLGIALMQVRGLAGNNSSMSRSLAVISSYSILEVMHADRANVVAQAYNRTMTANSCAIAGTQTYATTQLTNWCGDLASKFGANSTTTGVIGCDTTGVCTVTITYDDSRVGKGGYTTSLGLTSVVTKVAL